MSDLSLHDNNLSMEAGDTPRRKTKNDVFDTTGEIGEQGTPVIQVGDKAKVVDEGGDAGQKCVIIGQTGTQNELDDDEEGTLVPCGTADGDICLELLEQDLGTTRRLNELGEDKKAMPVPQGTAIGDLHEELLEHAMFTAGPRKELREDEATPVLHGTAVGDLCAEMLEQDLGTTRRLNELGEDKKEMPVPQGTAIGDLREELLEHAMFTAGPRKELRENEEATPVLHGTAVGDLCAEMLKHDVTIAGSPEKPDGEQAVHDANASPVALRVAAEEQKPPPKNLQSRDQPGSDLVHAEPGRDDESSQYSSGFLTHLTEEEFARAPKYAKGALSLDMVQNLVDCFNEALASKYRLLALPKSQVPKLQRGRVAAYREQETAESKQLRFLVESDLTGKGGLFGSRRTAASFFLLMRHCGKIREIRGPGCIVRYALH